MNYYLAVRTQLLKLAMLSRIHGLKGENDNEVVSVAESAAASNPASLGNPKDGAIIYMPAPSSKKKKHQSPQEAIDEFWAKFNSKTPGRGG